MNFTHSPRALELIERVRAFVDERILPIEERVDRDQSNPDWTAWRVAPEVEELKARARGEGLWNFFAELGAVDYAPLAEIMGHSFLAAEVFNCNAPDTGNMEVLEKYGTPEQKERWLEPLSRGEIRSAFCMTEPDVASSDATNIRATATLDGDDVVVNGTKWWSTGIGHPNCKVVIFMGVTDPGADRHQRHSMVLVPTDAPGFRIVRMLPVFGHYDAPYGHGEVRFDNVRVPRANLIAGPGRGFEIAQGRLGPGRIHHCMRAIGMAERALRLLIKRAKARTAFGKTLDRLGATADIIADARIAIEQARLLTLKAAWLIDTVGAAKAMSAISQIKVVAPNVAQRIIDQAIQIHGGAGVSDDDLPLTKMYGMIRTLRIADGPDEVHRGVIARRELARDDV
jgi:acyl-CoA dehydrogenase